MSHDAPKSDLDYIRRKKQIELKYAYPYLEPVVNPEFLSEPELRQRVRGALKALPRAEWLDMQAELERAWWDTHDMRQTDNHYE